MDRSRIPTSHTSVCIYLKSVSVGTFFFKGAQEYFFLYFFISNLSQFVQESDKLLAKVEKAGDVTEKEKNAQEKQERDRKDQDTKVGEDYIYF